MMKRIWITQHELQRLIEAAGATAHSAELRASAMAREYELRERLLMQRKELRRLNRQMALLREGWRGGVHAAFKVKAAEAT